MTLNEILEATVRNRGRQPRGRRWSLQNKLTALPIYKRGPKAYRDLACLIPLLSVENISRLLKCIPMNTGLNSNILSHWKRSATKMTVQDRQYILLFDGIALKKRLSYNPYIRTVDGYEDYGHDAMVLMLQGVGPKTWKQRIAYYFVTGTTPTIRSKDILPYAIEAVDETGLNVVATICDQSATNGECHCFPEGGNQSCGRYP